MPIFLYAFILFLCWFTYGLLHSLMASSQAKKFLQKGLLQSDKNYRLLFVAVSILSAIPVIYCHLIIPKIQLFDISTSIKLIGLMVSTSGLFVIKKAFENYNLKEFLGLVDQENSQELVIIGPQSRVRHPLYSGTILIFLGWFLYSPSSSNLALFIAFYLYILIGIYWEEKKLLKQFGTRYETYQRKTPALFPKWGSKKS